MVSRRKDWFHRHAEWLTYDKHQPFFRVVTYNLLAEDYFEQEQYPRCRGHMSTAEGRRRALEAELAHLSRGRLLPRQRRHKSSDDAGFLHADILCFQEDDGFGHWLSFLNRHPADHAHQDVKKKKKWLGRFCRRPSPGKRDGCGTYWRARRFRLVAHFEVHFALNPLLHQRKPNVALILVLQCKRTGNLVVVTNTHLYFNYKRGYVKLSQLQMLTCAIDWVTKWLRDPSLQTENDTDFSFTKERNMNERQRLEIVKVPFTLCLCVCFVRTHTR
ncbi:MAG: hypothetical protein MHM6MM_006411 [Cercozoa sp. M6MM]